MSFLLHQGTFLCRAVYIFNTSFKEIVEQCSRFAVSSLPITLTIVCMTSIIISMQVAEEMVKNEFLKNS